jgi:hypothetical protein
MPCWSITWGGERCKQCQLKPSPECIERETQETKQAGGSLQSEKTCPDVLGDPLIQVTP